jgi:signal transduction histidine kinase
MRGRLLAATAELERQRGELEAVVAGVGDGVFAVDRERRIRYLNRTAAEFLGVAPAAAVGRFCGDVLRPRPVDGERPCDGACPILHARFRGPARALESLDPPAGARTAIVSSSPPAGFAPGDDRQVQILRAETAAEAARRERDAVVAELAHELKTPLAAQSASLELLRERLGGGQPEARELAMAVEAATLRLRRLIENLLESIRIESGELGVRRLPVALDEVVEEATEATTPLLARRGQRLVADCAWPLPPLRGDPPRLVQALVNLLANASKYAPPGSEIRLRAAANDDGVELAVEDEGPGFDAALLERPGRRFRRGAAEPHEEGTGLGLWIARSIAERHGGALEVERRGDRTRVALRLPRAESPG